MKSLLEIEPHPDLFAFAPPGLASTSYFSVPRQCQQKLGWNVFVLVGQQDFCPARRYIERSAFTDRTTVGRVDECSGRNGFAWLSALVRGHRVIAALDR